MVLLIDNYDSFVYNLARYVSELGYECEVVRNDALSVDEALAREPDAIILSPGPCTPDRSGISVDLVRAAAERHPILGICLGHQCIAEAFGAETRRAATPRHGKASQVCHDGRGIFRGLPSPFSAGRYHSLVSRLAPGGPLIETAFAQDDGELMACAHGSLQIVGLQFHPESILTEHGHALLSNFLEGARAPKAVAT